MTTEHSTYTYESGAQETVALTRGPATPHGHALLKITYNDGEVADSYVNTAWLRDRAEGLGEPRPTAPRPLTPDAITDEMERRLIRKGVEFGWFGECDVNDRGTRDKVRALLVAALTEPTRPEGAEKVEAVLHQYWSGDIDGDDLADRIAEEMNR